MTNESPTRRETEQQGQLLMLGAVLCFSALGLTIRLASFELHFTQVACVRSLIGTLVALGTAWATRAPLRVENQRLAWGRSLVGALAMFAFFASLSSPSVALGDVATLRNLGPVLTLFGAAWLMREKLSWGVLALTALSVFGAILVVQPALTVRAYYAACAVAAAFLSAGSNLFLRALRDESHAAVVLHFSLVSAVVMAVFAAFQWQPITPAGALFLALAGLFGAGGQLLMTAAYARASASVVTPMSYASIAFSYVLGAWVLDETVSVAQTAGAVLIAGAGVRLLSRRV
ncbi:MAG: DMT family transporter [Myxococcota bacterium]